MPEAPEVDRQLTVVFDTNKCLGCPAIGHYNGKIW